MAVLARPVALLAGNANIGATSDPSESPTRPTILGGGTDFLREIFFFLHVSDR
jgi:hypothetical protein